MTDRHNKVANTGMQVTVQAVLHNVNWSKQNDNYHQVVTLRFRLEL